jgi:hypothetical protein
MFKAKLWFVVSFLLLSNCSLFPLDTENNCGCGYYNTRGEPVVWKTGSSLTFKLDPRFPEDLKEEMLRSFLNYNELLSNIKLVYKEEYSTYLGSSNLKYDKINGIYWLTDDEWEWNENPNAVAMTVVMFDNSQITEADIYFKSSYFDEQGINRAHLVYSGFMHELGHAIGRTHEDKEFSIMNRTLSSIYSFIKPPFTELDIKVFNNIYELEDKYK